MKARNITGTGMIHVEIDLIEDFTQNLFNRLEALEGEFVDVGVLNNRNHNSGYGNASIFKYLSEGNPARNLPPRNTLRVAFGLNPLSKSPMKKQLGEYLSNIKVKSKDPDRVLEEVGEFYRDRVKAVFGDTALIAEKAPFTKALSDSPDTPLIETGDLRDEVAYSVSHGPEMK